MTVQFDYTTHNDGAPKCGRAQDPGECEGRVFARTSRSGLTRAWICEGHAAMLDRMLDAIEHRYPEINHPEGCDCPGCNGEAG